MMKHLFLTLLLSVILPTAATAKSVVIYASRTATTESVANEIAKDLNCDIFEIEPALPYDEDYNEMYDRAFEEFDAIAKGDYPAIKSVNVNFAAYDNIFIGYPIWHGHMATPMQTFMHENATELAGKRISLFATSGSSPMTTSDAEARQLCPAATFTENLHLSRTTLPQMQSRVQSWLETLGVEREDDNVESNKLYLTANGQTMTATLVENSSTAALKALLADAPLTISMRDYGNMEKVGSLGRTLPDNDEYITTQAGDLILYQSSAFVIYYAPNSYSFTRLGKIDGNPTRDYLLSVLGNGNVNVTLSLSNGGSSGIDDIMSDNKNLKVHISGRTVEIADKEAGSMVNIYNLNGQTVYRGNSHQIELAEAGIYMVTCDNAKAKVLIY